MGKIPQGIILIWSQHTHAQQNLSQGKACKTFTTWGQCMAFLWPLVYMLRATVEVFWQWGSTVGMKCWILTHIHTHLDFGETFHKGDSRRTRKQHGPVAVVPLPVWTTGICFYPLSLPPSHPADRYPLSHPLLWCPLCFLSRCSSSIFWSSYHQPAKPCCLFTCPSCNLCLFRHLLLQSSSLRAEHTGALSMAWSHQTQR